MENLNPIALLKDAGAIPQELRPPTPEQAAEMTPEQSHENNVTRVTMMIEQSMGQISRLFTPECKMSLVIRNPKVESGEGDMIFSNDEYEPLILSVTRMKNSEKQDPKEDEYSRDID